MKINCTLVLFLALLPAFLYAQENERKIDEKGKQGHWIFFGRDRPGTGIPPEGKVEEGRYVNDRKEGKWIKYHDDGKTPKLIGFYVNNRGAGPYSKFHPNGVLKEKGNFVSNHNIDSLKRWYENGQLEYEAFFDEKGIGTGRVNWYHPNGRLERTYIIENGEISKCECYEDNGSFKGTCQTVSCPQPVQSPTYEQIEAHKQLSLPPIPEKPITNGEAFRENGYNKVYNNDRELWFDGIFKDGKLFDGKFYLYDHDGILNAVLIYRNGKYVGDGQL